MSKWISGNDIVKKYGIDSLELVEYISKGLLQPYHHQSYRSVPPPNIQQKKTKLEELKNELETLTNELAFCRSGSSSSDKQSQLDEKYFGGKIDFDTWVEKSVAVWHDHTPEDVKWLEIDIKVKQKLAALLEKQLSKVKNDSWAGYHLPDDYTDKSFMIDYFLHSQFKSAEVEKVIKHHKLGQREKTDTQNKTTGQDPDTFIRSLRISYDKEDRRIKIQEPSKKAKMHTSDSLEFNAETDNTWEAFLSIIQGQNTCYIGKAGKPGSNTRKEYDKKRAILKNINKILIKFFRKEFSLQIPANFKFYERNPAKGKGMYQFIFQTEYDVETDNLFKSKYDNNSKEDLLDHLKKMHVTYSEKPEEWLTHKIKDVTQILTEKHGLTQDEIKNILFTREEIQKDFSRYDFDTMDDVTDEP